MATRRDVPIPFYAEMGSVNPVTILPGALASRWEAIAAGLAGSVTLGAGQFCTNPGLVLTGSASDATLVSRFCAELARKVDNVAPADMLTGGIGDAYVRGLDALSAYEGVELLTAPGRGPGGGAVLRVSGKDFLRQHAALQEEVFGPSTLVVDCSADEALIGEAVAQLAGQLTATVWGSDEDLVRARDDGLLGALEERSGRVLFNGFPTGVEVCAAMNHGGPYPAASIDETSVGTEAIRRFVRPVCWQDCPDALLPVELQDANVANIVRKVNDVHRRGPVDEEYQAKQVVL